MTRALPEIIDLGVLDPVETEPGGPMFPAGMRRTLLAGAVTVLCLLGLGASAVRAPGLAEPLWTGTVSLNGFSLGTDVVFSTRTDGHAIIARDLRTGKQLWQLEIAEIPESTMDVGAGVTAVATRPLDNQTGRPRNGTTFLRTRTGEQIGRTSGTPGQSSVGGLPLVVFDVRDDCASRDMSCLTLSGWDLSTGKEVWRTDLRPDTVVIESVRGDLIDGLATVNHDGTVEMRDLASGSVLTSVRLPELAAVGEAAPRELVPGQATVLPSVLLTARRTGNQVTLTGYERPSLSRIWSVDVSVPPGDDPNGSGTWLGECGLDACLYVNGGAVRLIDPANGRVKAQTDLKVVGRLGNGVFLAVPPDQGEQHRPTIGLVLDPSMQVIGQLTVGDPVWWRDGGTRALFTQPGADRTGFVEIDEWGRQRLLGSVPGTQLTCDARGRFMACAEPGGTLRVWQLPD